MGGPSLLPREHGAYAQLGAALVSALLLGPGGRSLAQAGLTFLLFLASEPLLVLLGRRGLAARRDQGAAAGRRLALLGIPALLCLAGAWRGAPPALALTLLPPAGLGLLLFGLFLAGRERSGAGELLAAWTFAATAPAVATLGGRSLEKASTLALILGTLFSQGTLMVHAHLKALPRNASPSPRAASALLGVLLLPLAALLLLGAGRSPWMALAFLPMGAASLQVWRRPPAPWRLKAVGWTAAGCALTGGALAALMLLGR